MWALIAIDKASLAESEAPLMDTVQSCQRCPPGLGPSRCMRDWLAAMWLRGFWEDIGLERVGHVSHMGDSQERRPLSSSQ